MRTSISKTFLYSFTLTLGVCTGFVAVAWTGPTGTAPNNNVGAPINVSATAQSKLGGLVINSGGATNGLITYGKTGIGTASPSRLLSLSDTLAIIRLNRPSNTTSNYAFLEFSTGDVGKFYFGLNADTQSGVDKLGIYDVNGYSASNPVMVFTGGSVGIGTASPFPASGLSLDHGGSGSWAQMINYFNGSPSGAYGLYVYGTTYAVYANGPVYGSAFYYTSDERLKKNIQSIASSTALAKVLALNPVTYNWIAKDKPQGTQIGFIAQEVEKVIPELILTDPQSGLKSVDYARIVPLLTGAIQEQQAHIETQDAKLSAQQSEIDELKAEVELLKSQR